MFLDARGIESTAALDLDEDEETRAAYPSLGPAEADVLGRLSRDLARGN